MNTFKVIFSSVYQKVNSVTISERYLVGLILILFGAALRIWPLGVLETRAPWLTFYPMVMIASLFGGVYVGLFSTLLSCIIMYYFWQLLSPIPFLKDVFDILGMAVFFLNGAMISGVAEAMRRAQARAKKAQELSDADNKAKSIFLANMSHELRSPLNAILGFSQLLNKSAETSAKQKKHLDIISRSGEHLLHLINNVLDISKIESGKVVLEEKETDLYQILSEVNSSLYVKAVEKKLKLMVEIDPVVPHVVLIDGVKLKQVLYNLVGNAIKYTKQGSVTVRVNVGTHGDNEKRMMHLEVEDTGPGIKIEDRENVFLSFVQLKERLSSDIGYGLGLTISKQFVELMGGHIGVKGDYGTGSIFYVEIPVTEITAETDKELSNNREIMGVEETNTNYRVVIADDQLENRVLLHTLLEPYGIELRDAVNGREAIDLNEEWKPALIFMDIRMPEIDGMAATKIIRKKKGGSEVKIVALTAHAIEEERIEIMLSGCDDCIRKPYRDHEIYEALSKHIAVKFRYAAQSNSDLLLQSELNVQAFKYIPAEIVKELQSAVEMLDDILALRIIDKINLIDPKLGGKLSEMVLKIHHKEILSIVDSIMEKFEYGTRNT